MGTSICSRLVKVGAFIYSWQVAGPRPRTCPAPVWANFLLHDSPPGDEAMEPGRGCPMLQEAVGLGLLEPSPGLGLQGQASFSRHLLWPLSIPWDGGSFQGLGRCLDQGRLHSSLRDRSTLCLKQNKTKNKTPNDSVCPWSLLAPLSPCGWAGLLRRDPPALIFLEGPATLSRR